MGIGERVDERMEVVGISQAQLAREAGITAVAMMRIRTGQAANVRATTALRLAKSLKCNIEWLVFGKGPVESGATQASISSAMLVMPNPSQEHGMTSISPIGSPVDGEGLHALPINNDMVDFPQPCTVFFDPYNTPEPGDYVVVLTDKKELIVRKQRTVGDSVLLEATAKGIPDQFKFTELTEEMDIIGKVVCYSVTL